MWPDIDDLVTDENEENLKKAKHVKIPGKQLWASTRSMKELHMLISEIQQQIQDLTEENLNLQSSLGNSLPKSGDLVTSPSDQVEIISKLKTRLSQKDLEIVRLMGEKNEKLKELGQIKKECSRLTKQLQGNSPHQGAENGVPSMSLTAKTQRNQNEIKHYQTQLEALDQQSTLREKEMGLLIKEKMEVIDELKSKIAELERMAPPRNIHSPPTISASPSSSHVPPDELNALMKEMEKLQEENEMLQAEVASYFQEKDNLILQLETAQKKEQILEQNLQKINSQLINIKSKAEKQGSGEMIEKKIYMALKKENDQLSESFQIMTENFQSMSKKYQKMKEASNNLETQSVSHSKSSAKIESPIQSQESSPPESPDIPDFPDVPEILEPPELDIVKKPKPKIKTPDVLKIEDKPVLLKGSKSTPKPHRPKISSQVNLSGTQSFGNRIVCPSCGSSGRKIKIQEDKTQVISYIPRVIYKKKYFCSQCGYQFE